METDAPSVVVAEVFGPTLQGEGPSVGQRAAFVRLGGCNLHCTWCDTKYTWDAASYDLHKELTRTPVADILTQVTAMAPRIAVLTGGEPLLWQTNAAWPVLVNGLACIADVEVETNGTVVPRDELRVARFNVSPKLAHGGDPLSRRINREALARFAELAHVDRAVLKVVVKTAADVRRARQLADSVEWPLHAAYVMPEGTTVRKIAAGHRRLADVAVQEGLNMTTRLHVLAWGQERAR